MKEVANPVPAQNSVLFSRTLGIWSATALGGGIVLGIGAFVGGSHILTLSGTEAPLVYCIAALLFLPLIFSSVQRSSGTISNAGFYAAARASGSALRLFFTVWIMLAGYLALGALLAHGAAIRVNIGLERVFGLKIAIEILMLLLITAAFIKDLPAKAEGWRTRTAIFWSCTIFLLALALWGAASHDRAGAGIPKTVPMQHWLIAVSMLASGLWGMDIVLNYRGQLHRPNRTTIWSLITIFCGGNLLVALISVLVLRNPSLLMQNWLDALTWNENRLELLVLLAVFLICVTGLLRVMTQITRLLGAMILDGALPASDEPGKGDRIFRLYSALFCSILAFSAVSMSVTYLMLISGSAALLALVFYLQPLLKKHSSRMTEFSLPFHPMIPAVSIGISIFLIWILPRRDLLSGGLWLICGSVLFFTYARKRMLPRLQMEQVLAADRVKPSTAGYRILVCLREEEISSSLIRIGSALAADKQGELLVLRILDTSELLPSDLQRKYGENEWERIRNDIQKLQLHGPAAIPVVRLAPDPISGIKATAREFAVDFILVEWPEEPVERLRKSQLQGLLQLTAKPLGILKGELAEQLQKVSAACGSSTHTILALQIGRAVASSYGSAYEAVRIVRKSESGEDAGNDVRRVIQKSRIPVPEEIRLCEESDTEAGILKQTQESDLLLLGVSDDPLSGRLLPDGPSMEIAWERKPATLIVKANEESSSYWLHRFLAQITNHVTALTPKERSELLGNLKVGLEARTDFFLMVALAAAIAITGLIMNDGSIVLGAMLISPLMSPIVGIACGIALGNLDLMRRSGGSTFKGMALVLVVGIVMTFLLPSVEPTDQILSRTHPGIFDLLAALAAGAAGAYSLGRKTVAGALPGVAMSLSLEPPLATAGYGLSTSQFWIAGGAFLLFLTNMAAIVLSGAGVYILLGMRPTRKEGLSLVGKAVASVIFVTLVLVIPLGFGTYGSIQKGHLKYQIESQFRNEAIRQKFQLLDLKISEANTGFLIYPTVLASEEVTPEKLEIFRKAIEQKTGSPIQIDATILQTRRIESPEFKQEQESRQTSDENISEQ